MCICIYTRICTQEKGHSQKDPHVFLSHGVMLHEQAQALRNGQVAGQRTSSRTHAPSVALTPCAGYYGVRAPEGIKLALLGMEGTEDRWEALVQSGNHLTAGAETGLTLQVLHALTWRTRLPLTS